MKRLDKFFKNTDIIIDKEHKNNVKKEILKNYNSVNSTSNKIFSLKTLNLSLAGTTGVILIIFISVIIYNSYNKKIMLSQDLKSIYKMEKNNNFPKIKKSTLDKTQSPEAELHREKEMKLDINKQKDENQLEGQIFLSNLDTDQSNITEDSIENERSMKEESNSISKEKKGSVYDKKSDSTIMSKSSADDEYAFEDKKVKKDSNLISTNIYNHITVLPNTKIESFQYLLKQTISKSIVDTSKINEAEIINYFSENSIKSLQNNKTIIEGSSFLNEYFIFLGFNNKDIIKNLKIEIELKSNITDFNIIGYPIKPDNNIQNIQNNIYYNKPIILLLKIVINNIPEINQEIVNIKFSYINKLKNQVQFDRKILFSNIKQIDNTNIGFKKAILGYMIASEIKNKNYTVEQIINFKNKYFSNNDFDTDIQKLFKNLYQ